MKVDNIECATEEMGGLTMKIVPGQKVWVVERDKALVPRWVSSYIFISEVNTVAIVHLLPSGGRWDLDSILNYCLEESQENFICGFMAYPIEDCYTRFSEAESAMESEMSED